MPWLWVVLECGGGALLGVGAEGEDVRAGAAGGGARLVGVSSA